MSANITREGNFINIEGNFHADDLLILLAAIHHASDRAGFEDLTLNFKKCTAAYTSAMVPLCSQVISKRDSGVYIHLNLPEDQKLARVFEKANWAHLIDPRRYDPSQSFNLITSHVPATSYKNNNEQFSVVNQVLEVILGVMSNLKREDFQAFEWALNEITDNVLTHANSNSGGIVGLSLSPKTKVVQYSVADAGIGIGDSLRSGEYKHLNDTEALQYAVQEGVTRDPKVGQGNGLFGSFEISHKSQRVFRIMSGNASLLSTVSGSLNIKSQKIPYKGTYVYGEIDFSIPGLLANSLKFQGNKHDIQHDFIDQKYHLADDGIIHFELKNEATSFGTRPAGTPIRNKLQALTSITECKKIKVDFNGIHLISSSFADEAFAKLLKEIGPVQFMQKIEIINISKVCQDLMNRAITQRMKA